MKNDKLSNKVDDYSRLTENEQYDLVDEMVNEINDLEEALEQCEDERKDAEDKLETTEKELDEKQTFDDLMDYEIFDLLAKRFGYGTINEVDKIETFLTTLK